MASISVRKEKLYEGESEPLKAKVTESKDKKSSKEKVTSMHIHSVIYIKNGVTKNNNFLCKIHFFIFDSMHYLLRLKILCKV